MSTSEQLEQADRGGVTRRRILAGTGATAVAGALAACGTPGGEHALKPVTVSGRAVYWGNPAFPFDQDVGGEIVAGVHAKYPNVRIEFVANNDHNAEKLTVALAAGQPPDLVAVAGYMAQTLGHKRMVISLESYLKTSKNVKKNDLWPAHRGELTYKDHLYGLSYGPDARVLYTGRDAYQRAGLDYLRPPRTWDELEETIRRTMRREGDGLATLGFDPYLSSSSYNNWLVPFWQLGGELTNKEGTRITIANEYGIRALTWIQRLMDLQGGWNVVKAFRAGTTREQKFVDGKVANIYLTFATRNQEFRTLAPSGLPFGYASFPLPPGGRKATFGGNSIHVIPTGAKAQEAAWTFLEEFYDDENVLKYANRYDRVPVKVSVARSEQYLQNDPFRKLMIDDMAGRKWFVQAPGSPDMRQQILDLPVTIMEKGVSIQAALQQAQAEMQRVLDEALRL